jgi:Asp-tRNA(Asn)/Glu-tRNA(Gln) amidotransferase A subunit family amidase
VRQLLDELAARQVTATELVASCYARQERERELNAVVVQLREQAFRDAARADLALDGAVAGRRAAGPGRPGAAGAPGPSGRRPTAGPLHGIPVTVKLTIDVAGTVTEGLSVIPARDAAVVARLRRSGAIVIGKTNCPPGEADVDTYGPGGRTLNPWDNRLSPGGSSGGGAAAVAAGHSAADVGSDYAGSLRIPAACCGVVSYRPTPGVIPDVGHALRAPRWARDRDIGVLGPIVGSAAALSVLASVLAGRKVAGRPLLPAGRRATGQPSSAGRRASGQPLLRAHRPIAVWFGEASPYQPAADLLAVARSAVDLLPGAGLEVVEAAPRLDLDWHWQVFLRLIYLAERERGLAERERGLAERERRLAERERRLAGREGRQGRVDRQPPARAGGPPGPDGSGALAAPLGGDWFGALAGQPGGDGFEAPSAPVGWGMFDALAVQPGGDALDARAWARSAAASEAEQLALAVSAIGASWVSFFGAHDLLITPVLLDTRLPKRDPAVPLVADEYQAGNTRRSFMAAMVWASLASLSGLPAITLPAGVAGGMPVGLQLLARPGADALLIGAAQTLEQIWPQPVLPDLVTSPGALG